MDGGTVVGTAVGVATLFFVLITLIWGSGLWGRREKIRIKVTNLACNITSDRELKVYLGMEFRRSGGSDIRDIKQVVIRPDQEISDELSQYFELDSEGSFIIDTRIELPRDKFMSSYDKWEHPTYRISPNTQNPPQRSEVMQIASQLNQKSYKIGLVWYDNDKITWKTISPEYFAKWV